MGVDYHYNSLGEPLPISDRQLEILQLLADGWQNKEIAHRLKITLQTVKSQIQEAKLRLQAISRCNAVSIALRDGLIEFPREKGEPARRLLLRR